MEEREEIKQYLVKHKCPECKIGYLKLTGMSFPTDPTTFQHKCDNLKCNFIMDIRGKSYPYIESKEI